MTERSSGGGTKQVLHNSRQSKLATAHQQGPMSDNLASTADFQRKENDTASGKGIKFHGSWCGVGLRSPLIFLYPLETSER